MPWAAAAFCGAFLVLVIMRRRVPGAQIALAALPVAAALLGEIALRGGWVCLPLRENAWGLCGEATQPPRCRDTREPDEMLPDRVWRIDLHTDLLGNQAARGDFAFRGRTHPRAKPGFRIVCLGSSSTFGAGLRQGEAPYPAVLEDAIRRRCPGWTGDVVNAGLTGHHSFQLMILLRDVLVRMEPDLVVFYYGVNEGRATQQKVYYERARALVDAEPGRSVCERWLMLKYGMANRPALALASTLDRSRLVSALRAPIASWARTRYEARLRAEDDRPPDSREILLEMRHVAAAHGIRLLLVPELSAFGGAVNLDYASLMREAEGDGTVFVDPGAELPAAREGLFLDNVHFSAEGHRVFGEALAARLAPRACSP